MLVLEAGAPSHGPPEKGTEKPTGSQTLQLQVTAEQKWSQIWNMESRGLAAWPQFAYL